MGCHRELRMSIGHMAAVLLITGLVCCSSVTLGQQRAKLGDAIPEFRLTDLAGKEFRSSQLKGSVVVLDLWATWCEPCIADIPMFNRLQEKYAERGLKVVGIAVQSGQVRSDEHTSELQSLRHLV